MRRVSLAGLGVVLALALVPGPAGAQTEAPQWLAGDLHVHTTHSHDSYGGPTDDNTGPDQFYTLGFPVVGQFAVAASRGLDYVAITDHNDVRSIDDFGMAPPGLTPVPGYENSLRGHAQMLGATKLYDNGTRSVADVQRLADELRADGGVFQVNHPAEGSIDFPHDTDWEYLYEVVPVTVEVWNISRLWQPPMPSASSNDDAVRYWEGWLDRGHRLAATGGSDSHWVSTHAVQGAGQPTTWVYASDRSVAGILDGLRRGRTFITHQPPRYGGPLIFLEGDGDGDGGFEAMVGDAVPPGSALRVRVLGAPGSFLQLYSTGGQPVFAQPVPVTGSDFVHELTLDPDVTWARAEIALPDARSERAALCDDQFGSQTTYCRNQLLVLAMTSAIYFESERVPTLLTYTGDSRGRGETVVLAATLTDHTGAPLEGRTIRFDLDGQTLFATTDAGGRAETLAEVPDHGRSQTVYAAFAGDEGYEPSETSATITWGGGRPD